MTSNKETWFSTQLIFAGETESVSMNSVPPRLVIYPKDVMNITGCSNRTARRKLEKIRRHYNKSKDAYVSIEEFCAFVGLKEERVKQFLI